MKRIIEVSYLGFPVKIDVTDLGSRQIVDIIRSEDFFNQPYEEVVEYLNKEHLRPCLKPNGFTLLLAR